MGEWVGAHVRTVRTYVRAGRIENSWPLVIIVWLKGNFVL